MEIRTSLKNVLTQTNKSVYWLASIAEEGKIMTASSVYKYFAGEIDLVGEKRDQLIGLMSKNLGTPLVIGYALDGDMLFKTNVPLITLMESEIL